MTVDPDNNGGEKVIIQSLAGAGPDVFDMYGVVDLEHYVTSGIVLDVTEAAHRQHFSPERVWPSMQGGCVWEGRQYSFPDNVVDELMLYHKDVFDAAHVPYPKPGWTWMEALDTMKKLSREDVQGLRTYGLLTANPLDLIISNGGVMFTADGTRCIIDSPAAVAGLQFYQDLRTKYHVMPTASDLASQATAGGFNGNASLFATKRFAITAAGRWWLAGYAKEARELVTAGKAPKLRLGVTTVPYMKKPTNLGSLRSTGINRLSPHIKYAERFLEFLATQQFNEQINSGYDALAAVKAYCTGPAGIASGAPPPPGLEIANDPLWVSAMQNATLFPQSPYIAPIRVETLWTENTSLLDAGGMDPAGVLHKFSREVNEEIQRNLATNPKMRARFQHTHQEGKL